MADNAGGRKIMTTTLSEDNAEKLKTMSERSGVPKTKILDSAVDMLYRKEEAMETGPRHKGTAILVMNNKGGVGKTTCVAALADLLAKRGKRVLVIDTDPQGNLSALFGIDDAPPNYLGALIEERLSERNDDTISYFIHSLPDYERVDIIPADVRLDKSYVTLMSNGIASTFIFRNIVDEVRALDKYDYILFDGRPALSNEVSCLFVAGDYVLIPINSGVFSIYGAANMIGFMNKAQMVNKGIKLLGLFFNDVSERTQQFHEAYEEVKAGYGSNLLETKIPHNEDVKKTENIGGAVTSKRPSSKAARAYRKLLDEVVARIEN